MLLMCAFASRDRQIIATGALGGQPHGVSEDDVEVLPVGSLPEKLCLVLSLDVDIAGAGQVNISGRAERARLGLAGAGVIEVD